MIRASATIVAALCTLADAPAVADAPPGRPGPVHTICAGSPAGGACATIDRRAGRTTVRRRQGTRAVLWTMAAAPEFASLGPDGRFLVEEHRAGGLIDAGDGPATPLLTLRERGRVIRRVTLADLKVGAAGLPETASHRVWSRMSYFPDASHYAVVLADGRERRFDLADGGRMR